MILLNRYTLPHEPEFAATREKFPRKRCTKVSPLIYYCFGPSSTRVSHFVGGLGRGVPSLMCLSLLRDYIQHVTLVRLAISLRERELSNINSPSVSIRSVLKMPIAPDISPSESPKMRMDARTDGTENERVSPRPSPSTRTAARSRELHPKTNLTPGSKQFRDAE